MNCSLFLCRPTIVILKSERNILLFQILRTTASGDHKGRHSKFLFLLDLVELCIDFEKIFLCEDTLNHA